jgi:hypothetical protein
MTAARGIRNRNPGNIVVSGWTQRQHGYLGPEPEGRFARFDTMANGVLALLRLLLVYRDQHKLRTVRQIINRWAPPVENDTGSYVLSVAKAIGVGIDDELPADPEVYTRLARAIVGHENGRDAAAAVTDEDYEQAAVQAFMLPQPAGATPPAAPPSPVPAPAAPTIGERAMAIPALVTAAASALLPIIADLFRARGSKTGTRNADIVDAVGEAAPAIVAIAKEVAGGGNEQQAAEAILASKELQQQFRAQVALQWSDLEPFLRHESEERSKARDFAERMTAADGPEWRQIGFGALISIMSLTIVVGGGAMFWNLMSSPQLDPGQKGLILGALIASFTTVVGYFFGSSATSRQKDATIAEQAKR